jgi:hypothetical protein
MRSVPGESPWSGRAVPDLVGQASSVLAREASRFSAPSLGVPVPPLSGVAPAVRDARADGPTTGRTCPVTGAKVQPAVGDTDRLRQQAYDLVAALLPGQALAGGGPSREGLQEGSSAWPGAAGLGTEIHRLGTMADPLVSAAVPVPAPDLDLVRRQAHEFIESLLVTFSQATGEKAAPYEDQVPLIRCVAPVEAGGEARATMAVANDEDTPSDVSLYCTNFVADSGSELPSLRVTVSPRRATIPPRGEMAFEIKIAIPQQTPAGIYSGLIQAMGSKYVKAVLSVEIL